MTATRQVALIRGINVGGHAKLAMADLRRIVTGLGYDGVRTHLQSGNVVLTTGQAAATVAAEIEKAIAGQPGLAPRVLVLSRAELAAVIEANPMPEATANGSRFFVTFLWSKPAAAAIAAVDPAAFVPDRFEVVGKAIYLHCPDGLHDSKLAKALSEERLGVVATTRNWNTVTRLLALADEG